METNENINMKEYASLIDRIAYKIPSPLLIFLGISRFILS